jgi:large subunit ribosomal protein L25
MPSTVQLIGTIRHDKGKGAARKIRGAKHIPGIVYGKGRDSLMITLPARDFLKTVSGHSTSNLIVDLQVEGVKTVKTLIREIQVDPVTGIVMHVDLNEISLTNRIEVEIPIELDGVPIGVKNSGGILQHPVRTLSIKCLPQDMPEVVRLDVSNLEIGDAIRVESLGFENVEIMADSDTTLASVIPPTKAEEVAVVEGEELAEGAEAAEPDVVGKEKKEGEEGKEGKEGSGS